MEDKDKGQGDAQPAILVDLYDACTHDFLQRSVDIATAACTVESQGKEQFGLKRERGPL